MNPITIDTETGKTYTLSDVQCSKTATPPQSADERRAVELQVWEEIDWVGLRFVACETATPRS
jgi:hypothetical protein